jgi:SAM-dependent methyltransferase
MFDGVLERGLDAYRGRILDAMKPLLAAHQSDGTALDFGAGDGWFARQFLDARLAANITAVDVKKRDRVFVPSIIFDGRELPFPDRSFDLSYSIDVLHHCPDPHASLSELLRCTARFLVIKDHTYRTPIGRVQLSILDELGNRRFGVPSLYRYQRAWRWFPWIERAGFKLRTLVHPAPCHAGLYGWFTNRLHFIAVWERQ